MDGCLWETLNGRLSETSRGHTKIENKRIPDLRVENMGFTVHFVPNLDSHLEEAFAHLLSRVVRFGSSFSKMLVTFFSQPALISISLKGVLGKH